MSEPGIAGLGGGCKPAPIPASAALVDRLTWFAGVPQGHLPQTKTRRLFMPAGKTGGNFSIVLARSCRMILSEKSATFGWR
jgi:hypothetical protein